MRGVQPAGVVQVLEGFVHYKADAKASPRPASSYRGARRNAARSVRRNRRAAERKAKADAI